VLLELEVADRLQELRVGAMISGPIPSPGRVTMWWLICLLFWLVLAGPAR